MPTLTREETELLQGCAAEEHARRQRLNDPAAKLARARVTQSRKALVNACLSCCSSPPAWLPLGSDAHVHLRTAQSQRAISSEALADAIAAVSEKDIALQLRATCSPSVPSDDDKRAVAWWECVVREAHAANVVSTPIATIVNAPCPRKSDEPGYVVPTDAVRDAATALRTAVLASQSRDEANSGLAKSPHRAAEARLCAALIREYGDKGPRVCVATTDGEAFWYTVNTRNTRTTKSTTPAHLRRATTVAAILPHVHRLYATRNAPGAHLHEAVATTLQAAKNCNSVNKQCVAFTRQRGSKKYPRA